MIRHRTAKEVKQYDIFKLIVTFVLLAILFFSIYNLNGASETDPALETTATVGDVSGVGPTEAVETVSVTDPAETAEAPQAETGAEPAVQIESQVTATAADIAQTEFVVPTIDLPEGQLTPGRVTLSGTGEPGTTVQIVVDGNVVDVVPVADDGTWSFGATLNEPGEYEVSLNTMDVGSRIVNSSEPVVVTVAALEAEAPSPTEEPTISVAPDEVASPQLISPQAGDRVLAGRLTLRGTGEPGSTLAIEVNGEAIGTTTVRESGAWSFNHTIDESGEMEIVVNVAGEDGTAVAPSESVTVLLVPEPEEEEATVETEPADATGLTCEEEYTVLADDWLSKLSDKYYNDLFLYPAIVTATNQKREVDDSFAEIENPDLIEPGWKLCIVDAEAAQQLVEEEGN